MMVRRTVGSRRGLDLAILCNISGGVDSVYSAYAVLKGNPEDRVVLHHMARSTNIRQKLELAAVKQALGWLMGAGLTNFVYMQSEGGRSPETVAELQDIELLAPHMGAILRQHPTIGKVVISANAEDLKQGAGYEKRSRVRFEILESVARRTPEYLWPISHMTKRDIIAAMPESLFRLCWYCRRPTADLLPCGRCNPCRHVAGKEVVA